VIKVRCWPTGPAPTWASFALGRNVLVAFMPWRGYNFEDAILVSEKLVREDYYTSIHIEEFEIEARDTKLGPEKSRATSRISRIRSCAIWMNRRDPHRRHGEAWRYPRRQSDAKGETQLTPEEKLLRAIFGERPAT